MAAGDTSVGSRPNKVRVAMLFIAYSDSYWRVDKRYRPYGVEVTQRVVEWLDENGIYNEIIEYNDLHALFGAGNLNSLESK